MRPSAPLVTALLALTLGGCQRASRPKDDAAALRAAVQGARGTRTDSARLAAAGSSGAAGTASAAGGWTPLFNGTSLAGWHNVATPGQPATGWSVEGGVIVRTGDGGDLVTDRQYANFELELEWQVAPGGNSGVIYRIDPAGTITYRSGPEMQVLDDAGHPDGQNSLTSAGAVFALYPAPRGVVKPAGQWNTARLVVNGAHVEHWLNGQRVVQYELGSPDWEARRAASKFADVAEYGRRTTGSIALQDHGDRVSFRNLRIRELP
ncbi:MAG: DUF1080 domain-containing protein [Gemmatimonadetes bacterium]|nr:DUF1080 domain-containing protein [Gemmatimonadota bacterium]